MSRNKLYLTGIIAVAAIGALLQYQLCCSESALSARTQALLIDKDNTEALPKWQISGLAESANSGGQNFLFNSGTQQLQPIGSKLQSEVKRIVSELEKTPFKSLQVTGQYREGQPYELGLNRANAVSHLFSDAGLSSEQLVTQVSKVKQIPTKGAQSVATALAIITNQSKFEAFEAGQLAEKEAAARLSAEQQAKTLAEEKATAEEKVNQITSAKNALTDQLAELNSEKIATEVRLNTLLTEKQSLKDRLKAAEAKNATLAEKGAQAETALATSNQELSQKLSESKSTIDRLKTTIESQKNALAQSEEKISQMVMTATTQRDENQQATTDLKLQLAQAETDLSRANETIESLTSELEGQTAELKVAKVQVAQVEKSQQTIALLEQRLAQAETDKTEVESRLQTEITAHNAAEKSLEALKQQTETTLSASKATIASLTTKLTERDSALTKAKAKVEQALLAASSQSGANEALTALNQQVTTLEAEKQTVEEQLAHAITDKQGVEELLAQATTAKQALEAQLTQATAAKQALEEQLAQATTAKQALEAQLTQATTAKQALEAQLSQATTAKQALETQLAQEIDARKAAEASQLTAIKAADKKIADSIRKAPLLLYFKTNQSAISLNTEQQQKVALIKKYLEDVPSAELLVIGHTDNVGQRNMNIALGLRRANFAADWLAQSGIARDKMVVESKGPDAPIVINTSRANRALNRRVEVTIK